MDLIPVGFAVVFLIVVLVIVLLARREHVRRKQALTKLAEELGSNQVFAGSTYEGNLEGTAYRFMYQTGSRNAPAFFKVGVEHGFAGPFQVVREKGVHRFFKNIGISAEIQTGDRAFDRDFYIETELPEVGRQIFADARQREAFKRVFDLGFTQVTHDGKSLEAKINRFKLADLHGAALVEDAVRALRVIGDGLERITVGPAVVRRDAGWRARRVVLYSLSIGSAVAATGALFWGHSVWRPLDPLDMFLHSLWYGVPAFVGLMFLSVGWLRGRSSSHLHLSANLAVGLFAVPALAFGTLMVLNGWLDESEAGVHRVPVLDKYTTTAKNSKKYYLVVESWRVARDKEEIRVGFGFYNAVQTREHRLMISTRPGRYGYEWIVDFHIVR